MGARLLFSSAVVITALSLARFGEYRALRPSPELPGGFDRPTLLFVFQPEDCSRYAGLVQRWNALAGAETLHVLGLGIGFPSTATLKDPVLGDSKPVFDVRYDLGREAQRLLGRIGQDYTPTTVLLDRDGRPVFILPPTADPKVHEEAALVVQRYVSHMAGAGW